ncbi:MAG: SpoIIE family protein phosphatase [Acidobacteria bacterium]|nr:SpoIIE family protein phosphatase [Acidobacteriota bacterium]
MTPVAEAPPVGRPELPGQVAGRLDALRHWATGTWAGRLILGGVAAKALAALVRWPLGREPLIVATVDVLGSIALVAAAFLILYRIQQRARRRLLWRVRRKLILSYVFMGVVPALLIVSFFLVAGLILFLNVASYLVRSGLGSVTADALNLARVMALEIRRTPGPADVDQILQQRQQALAARYPGASIALVPTGDLACAPGENDDAMLSDPPPPPVPVEQPAPNAPGPSGAAGTAGTEPQAVRPAAPTGGKPVGGAKPLPMRRSGPWAHEAPPAVLPAWISCRGFGGLLVLPARPGDSGVRGVLRGVGFVPGLKPAYAVVVDVPKNDALAQRLRETTSIKIGDLAPVSGPPSAEGQPTGASQAAARAATAAVPARSGSGEVGSGKRRFPWVAWLEYTDWATGRTDTAAMTIEVNIPDIYDQLSAAQARIQSINVGSILLLLLLVVGLLFLLIEAGALVMGLALARSITGSVHQLFTGTERVRRGDFSHRIEIPARDQLGELAESFNQMTASIEDLLRQAEEKKRLEEELRIAREIQMSLLPRGKAAIPGLAITTLCVPAREVGGDYYDLLPIDEDRFAVLIADVAGKGTSAALYMAELKGVVLSLVRSTPSPRQLLIAANRIISEHLDSRAFITMTYAVVDLQARTMTYARAGHTPLIYRTANGGRPDVRILTPDGLVLGLRIDSGELFERLLKEESIPLRAGDLLLFFTDGISEAMNGESQMFGEARLGQLVAEHGDLPADELRERMLREIDAFVAGAPQHDDMTMILMKFDDFVPGGVRRGLEHVS